MKFSNHIIHYSKKNWSFKSYQKPLIERLLCVLINRIKKSDSPVKLREKMLNFVVKYCENCMFCRAQVIICGKTSHISWRHSTFLKSSRQERWSSAISWRQNKGKMAERDRSHVIAVLQSLKTMKSLVGANVIFDYDTTYKSFTLGIYLGKSIICFNFDYVLNKKDYNKAETTVGPPLLPIKPLHKMLPLTNLRGTTPGPPLDPRSLTLMSSHSWSSILSWRLP